MPASSLISIYKALFAALVLVALRWSLCFMSIRLALVLGLGLATASYQLSKLGRGRFGPERQMKSAAVCLLGWLVLEVLLGFRLRHAVSMALFGTVMAVVLGSLFVLRDQLLVPVLTAALRQTGILGASVTLRFDPPAVVISDVQLWPYLVRLANERFFFGPLCMPCDWVRCDEIRVDMRPRRWLTVRTVPFSVTNLRWQFHRAHEDEWREAARHVAYTRWRRSHADWVCSLVEPGPTWSPAWW
jgi:hypothetical protein